MKKNVPHKVRKNDSCYLTAFLKGRTIGGGERNGEGGRRKEGECNFRVAQNGYHMFADMYRFFSNIYSGWILLKRNHGDATSKLTKFIILTKFRDFERKSELECIKFRDFFLFFFLRSFSLRPKRWKVWRLHKRDSEELRDRGQDSSDSESGAVEENCWTTSKEKLLNVKLDIIDNNNQSIIIDVTKVSNFAILIFVCSVKFRKFSAWEI